MKTDVFEFSKAVGISIDDTEKAFQELKRRGFVFTHAKNAAEFASRKYPARIIGLPPNDADKPSVVSFGPFAVDRKRYEQLKSSLEEKNPEEFKVLMGFLRLIYEKTGSISMNYKFSTKSDFPESEYIFLSMTTLWDLDNPIVFDEFVWFTPTDKVKSMIEEDNKVKFGKNDFSWWNYRYDLGTEIELTTLSDYPELYHWVPNDFIDLWGVYLPKHAFGAMLYLYRVMLDGKGSKSIGSLQEILLLIEEGAQRFMSTQKEEKYNPTSDIDLLLKELYDYNSISYPINATSILDFLQQVGLVTVVQENAKYSYQIPLVTPKPKKVFKFPKNWRRRMDEYIEKGTILFSYLTIEEIVK